MDIRQALERLAVLENGDFHYSSCGLFNQSIVTVLKPLDDPTRRCTCGRNEALEVIAQSRVGTLIYETVLKNLARG